MLRRSSTGIATALSPRRLRRDIATRHGPTWAALLVSAIAGPLYGLVETRPRSPCALSAHRRSAATPTRALEFTTSSAHHRRRSASRWGLVTRRRTTTARTTTSVLSRAHARAKARARSRVSKRFLAVGQASSASAVPGQSTLRLGMPPPTATKVTLHHVHGAARRRALRRLAGRDSALSGRRTRPDPALAVAAVRANDIKLVRAERANTNLVLSGDQDMPPQLATTRVTHALA